MLSSDDGARSSSMSAMSRDEWLGGSEDSSSEWDRQTRGRRMSVGGATHSLTSLHHQSSLHQQSSLYRQFSQRSLAVAIKPRARVSHKVSRPPAGHGEQSDADQGPPDEAASASFSSSSGEDNPPLSSRHRDSLRHRSVATLAPRLDGPTEPSGQQQADPGQQPAMDERPGAYHGARYCFGPDASLPAASDGRPRHTLTYTVQNVPKCRQPIMVRRHTLCRQPALHSPPSPVSCLQQHQPAMRSQSSQASDPRQHQPALRSQSSPASDPRQHQPAVRSQSSPASDPRQHQQALRSQSSPASDPRQHQLAVRSQSSPASDPRQHQPALRSQSSPASPPRQQQSSPQMMDLPRTSPSAVRSTINSLNRSDPQSSDLPHTEARKGGLYQLAAEESRRTAENQGPCSASGPSEDLPGYQCGAEDLGQGPVSGGGDVPGHQGGPEEPGRRPVSVGGPRLGSPRRLLPPAPGAGRRLLPPTPQSSVESAPAALGRPSPPPPCASRLAASSTPCLALSTDAETAPGPAPQYFRYSHLLIFPLQSLDGTSGLRAWTPPSDPPPPPPPPPPESPRRPGGQRVRQPNGQPKTGTSDRRSLPSLLTKSLPSILVKEPESDLRGGTEDAASAAGAGRKPRPSLCGYDPYDPYRPVRFKRPKTPPQHQQKSRSKSLFNLEWKVLKALERRAFRPPLRAWRSGIDVSTSKSAPSLVTNEHLVQPDPVGSVHPLTGCGRLEAACAYDEPTSKLTVQVLQAKGVPRRVREGGNYTQVQLALLPGKKQKFRTRLQYGDNPQFNQAFVFSDVSPDQLEGTAVRLRLVGSERLRRQQFIGEAVLRCRRDLLQTQVWLTLQPHAGAALLSGHGGGDLSPACRSDSSSSTQSLQRWGVPELLLGLQYSNATGRLAAEIVKGSHFRSPTGGRAPDTYVRLLLLSSGGRELARRKTSVRRAQPNPLYKETFLFQLPLFQLPDVTLMVSVYNKQNMRKTDLIGWFGMGQNSTGEEEHSHWFDARDANGAQICRWHLLRKE